MPVTRSITRARPMPLRCAVACCRSGIHPTSPSSPDALWITNAVLNRAIERFHHAHPIPCRRLSSCPGPIESRRRLGKRHMTAILPESRASPLPWTIDLPYNLGEWAWEPPNAPADRHKKKPSRFERLIRWLEGPTQEDASIPAPTSTNPAETISAETVPAETISEAQEVLAEFRDALASLQGRQSRASLSNACGPYTSRILELIRLRAISLDDMTSALDPFDSRIREKVPVQILDCIHAWYLQEVVDAIYASRIAPSHDAFGKEFWDHFFDQVITLTPQRPTFRLFQTLVIKGVQRISFRTVPEYYRRLFLAHIKHQASLPEQNAARAAEQHATLFEQVKFFRKGGLVEFCNKLIESCMEIPGDDEFRKRIAYHLLQTLAYIIPLSKSTFGRFASRINGTAPWRKEEAFILVRARLLSKARNRINVATYYHRSLNMRDGHHWAWLIKAALGDSSERQLQNLRTLTHSCNVVGNLDALLMAAARMRDGGSLLRDILVASRDPYVAVAAWATYNEGRETKAKWGWHIWLPYIRALIEDPEIDVALIWDAVDLLPFKSMHTLAPKYHWEGIGDRMTLLERMADWFMLRTDVTPRQQLRFVEKCIAHGQVAGGPMSKRLMANLAKLVIRDLEEGSLGRTARLQYLIKMVELHLGPEEAAKVRHQLEGWRWIVVNQDFGNKPKTKFDLEEELDELRVEMGQYENPQGLLEEDLVSDSEYDLEEYGS
ncbi:hypothetical protein LCI18_010101 [Fusarium solani-melongenae]|uniref:Uncharacterized protein n=1 Tax=Fusarium solani subsp. cucurbitae TaxID=2747967 RepID=A0ACD3ZDF0_FUSSC|nr:hypothetical protein LCI18_010101 [Fusarium solani-melongenae]